MSGRAATPDTVAACASCLRRSWLLAALGGPLDYQSRDRERLMDTLALGDRELMRALAGRRRSELQAEHAAFAADRLPRAEGVQVICRHDDRFPAQLGFRSAPVTLWVARSSERLRALVGKPVVAIMGARRASDYGMEMAGSLARGLAAAGVTVACGLQDGIGVAALAGATEVDGAAVVCTMPGGVDVIARLAGAACTSGSRDAGALSPSCPAARPCGAGPRWPPCASAWGSRT